SPLLGKTIGGRYRIESVIGEGAQGVVYLARRGVPRSPTSGPAPAGSSSLEPSSERFPLGSDERVAPKGLHRHLLGDQKIFKRFYREAEILKRAEGEHLVKLLDFVEEDGLLFLALEYVDGTSLEQVLADRGPLSIPQAIEIALQVCAALGCAH